MKRTILLLRLAVVMSSLLLVGGFVSFRAGALNGVGQPALAPADPETSPKQEPYLYDGTSKSMVIFHGSKDAVPLIGSPTSDQPNPQRSSPPSPPSSR